MNTAGNRGYENKAEWSFSYQLVYFIVIMGINSTRLKNSQERSHTEEGGGEKEMLFRDA